MIGNRISQLRQESDLSQVDLAKYLGIGRSTVNAYERDVILPPPDKLIKIADKFNVSVDYILGRTTIRNTQDAELLKTDIEKQLHTIVEALFSNQTLKFAGETLDTQAKRIMIIQLTALRDTLNILTKH